MEGRRGAVAGVLQAGHGPGTAFQDELRHGRTLHFSTSLVKSAMHKELGPFASVLRNCLGGRQSRSATSLGGPGAGRGSGPERRGKAVSVREWRLRTDAA